MNNGKPLLVIFDLPKRLELLTQAHEQLGHKGERVTWEIIQHHFYWPFIFKDVRHHVTSYHECQIRNTQKIHIPVTILTPATIFSKVHLDIMYMPNAGGF